MKVGTANYNKGQSKKKNHYDLGNGDLVARILPPLGHLADKGIWSRFHSLIFGFKNAEGKLRVFESPQVKDKNKNVTVKCAATDLINNLQAQLLKARADGNGPVMAKLNKLVGYPEGFYNISGNHHMNVILLDGSIGELKIRHKAKLALQAEIDRLRAEGVDPLSADDGRFFVFSRSNLGRDTTYSVKVYTEKLKLEGVGQVERPVVHKLTPDILARLETEAFDLDNIAVKVTEEECAQIVNEADLMTGKSPACNRIFDDRWKANYEARKNQSDLPGGYSEPDAPTTPQTLAPAGAASALGTLPTLTTTTTLTAAQPGPKHTDQPATKPTTATLAVDELSDDEFFKQLGVNA